MTRKILVTIVTLVTLVTLVGSVYAAWYTLNSNPTFSSSSNWTADTWMEGSGSHSYWISGGEALTQLSISGFSKWGNTEYEQGTDPWATYGSGFTPIPADQPMRLITNTKVTQKSATWWCGRTNCYVEFWLTNGQEWAEAMIILCSEGLIYPANAGENGYWHNTNPGWYFVGYRHWNIGGSYTYLETNLNWIFNQLETYYGLDLSEWTVSCICFGVEGTSGSMTAMWGYVQFDVGM